MAAELTPMMKQYHAIRQSLPSDVLLLFRLGDFYELFFEDAKTAADILKLTLTRRNGIPMAGVPFHAAAGYVRRLVKAGKRVAIAEQTSEPVAGKLTNREISQVISAGTVDDMAMLEADRPLYLAAVFEDGKRLGLAYVDHTTGIFRLTEFGDARALEDELASIGAAEVLYSTEQADRFCRLSGAQVHDGYAFLYDQAFFTLREHFKVQSLDGFGCTGMRAAVGAAGAILHYLRHSLQRPVDHLRRLQPYQTGTFVVLDSAAQQHLDLVQSRAGKESTLLGALDRTQTPMGARALRDWILRPLRSLQELLERQDFIAVLIDRPSLLGDLREQLRHVRDVERTAGRLSQGGGNGRDLQALAASLKRLPDLRDSLETLAQPSGGNASLTLAGALLDKLADFSELAKAIDRAVVDEPPATIKDGGFIRDGYHEVLDELRGAAGQGKEWIAQLQAREIEATGIKSLKVRYNSVFGYFIEISKANVEKAPPHYHRKQTMVNAERFITPELKQIEDKILGAEERAKKLEVELFHELRTRIGERLEALQIAAEAVATIDVLAGLAETARLFNYCRPLLNESLNLYIKDGRHPVLDQVAGGERFVPNDAALEPDRARLHLITGPNMAGKSTYIRQVALLTLMAQMGSFLPAASAEIGLVDRIFTRVGASDDLARGQSTFMVEMNETALIVNNATDRSLVILDEIGRGTSTFDGLSLAWSIAEHLHDKIRARTLFATHYHELTALAKSRPGVQNYNVAVREWNDQVIFLRKIVAGAADKSYGIHVARLAGLPDEIVERAKVILAHLEANAASPEAGGQAGSGRAGRRTSKPRPAGRETAGPETDETLPVAAPAQLTLF
ncbi:MAG: DNA mismatch repair protein MutS [Verrucomicrobiales bacterium]